MFYLNAGDDNDDV